LLFLILLLLTSGVTIYYLLTVFENQRIERIKPLIDSGLSLRDAIRFDERFSEKFFLLPLQKSKPYSGDEIRFAEMWVNNSIITEILLNYYYWNSSNYYCLVWLLGDLKRGLSYWDDAVKLVVHGDANGDGIDNYDSLLGPNSDVLNTFKPNPVTIYALEKNLSKEVIKRLKTFETDGKMDRWEKRIIDMVASHDISEDYLNWIIEKRIEPNPAVIYAIEQNLPRDLIKRLEPLGEDGYLAEWEKNIIENFSKLPLNYVNWILEKAIKKYGLADWERYIVDHVNDLPYCFVEKIVTDGKIDYEEWMQARFLERFSEEDLEGKDADWINDPDLDDDGFTNEFEVNFSFTDPFICNDRYIILAYSKDLSSYLKANINAVKEFLASRSYYKMNIYELCDENVTYQDFRKAIDDISSKSDENDMLFFFFVGHGERNRIFFSDRDVDYEGIGRELARVKSKVQICIIDACYSGSAIEHLESENRIIITSCRGDEKSYEGMFFHSFFSVMQNRSYDKNGDGYCSVLESFYGAKSLIEDTFEYYPQLSYGNFTKEVYFVEDYSG